MSAAYAGFWFDGLRMGSATWSMGLDPITANPVRHHAIGVGEASVDQPHRIVNEQARPAYDATTAGHPPRQLTHNQLDDGGGQ
ncbi:MAG: hypothetical protein WBQ18_05575 [Solirubrobacteraceae bacterium]